MSRFKIMNLNLLSKLKFFLKKPKLIIIVGKDEGQTQKIVSHILRQYFKIGSDFLILETEEKEIDKLSFFIKNSSRPILVMNETNGKESFFKRKFPNHLCFVLNWDNEKLKEIDNLTDFKKLKFGLKEGGNDVFVSDIKYLATEEESADPKKEMNFKVNYKGSIVPFWLASSSQLYPVLAAVCVGLLFDLNLVEISEALKKT